MSEASVEPASKKAKAATAEPGREYVVDRKEQDWYPFKSKEMLRLLAVENTANFTDKLDYVAYRTPLCNAEGTRMKLECCTDAYPDNFLVRTIVPDYHIVNANGDAWNMDDDEWDKRTRRSSSLGKVSKAFRLDLERFTMNGINPFCGADGKLLPSVKISPVGIAPICAEDMARIRALARERGDGGWATLVDDYQPDKQNDKTKFFWQLIKVACADVELASALAYVSGGSYCGGGMRLWFKDLDTTIDTRGVFVREELRKYLITEAGFAMEGQGQWAPKTVLDNVADCGHNCLTWMTSIVAPDGRRYRVRLKLYLKLPQEFEKGSVRTNIGQHVWDWIAAANHRLLSARDATVDSGLTRAEITVYYDRRPGPGGPSEDDRNDSTFTPDFDKAHTFVSRDPAWMTKVARSAVDVVPEKHVWRCPHWQMITNWLANYKHTVVVYDNKANIGLIAYGYHRDTRALSGMYVQNWSANKDYAMQHLALGTFPIDVVGVDRGKHDGKLMRVTTSTVGGNVHTKDIWQDDRPKAPLIPLALEKVLNLKAMYKTVDGQVLRVQRRFRSLVSKEWDVPVTRDGQPKPPGNLYDILVANGAAAQADDLPPPTEEGGSDNEDAEMEGEGGEDAAADLPVVAEEDVVLEDDEKDGGEGEEGSVHAEEVDPEEYLGSDCKSTAVGLPGAFAVEDGVLRITSTRFLRFPLKKGGLMESRFALTNHVAVAINPAGLVKNELEMATTEEEKARVADKLSENRSLAAHHRVHAGLVQPDGTPIARLAVDLPVVPFLASKRAHAFVLVKSDTSLEVNINSVLVPSTFLAVAGYNTYRGKGGAKAKKSFYQWFEAVLTKRDAARLTARVAGMAQTEAEWSDKLETHEGYAAVYEFTTSLSRMAHETTSLLDLMPGNYSVHAIQERKKGVNIFYLSLGGDGEIIAVSIGGGVASAMETQAQVLDDLRYTVYEPNSSESHVFYLDPTEPSKQACIGTLRRTNVGQKWLTAQVQEEVKNGKRKRLPDAVLHDSGGVKQINTARVGFSLVLKDCLLYTSDAQKVADAAAAAAAAVAENTQPVPELLPQDIEGGTAAIKDFHAHFHDGLRTTALKLRILATGNIHGTRRKDAMVMRVQEGDNPPVVVWMPLGFPVDVRGKLFGGCFLHIGKVGKKNVSGATVVCKADTFVPPTGATFHALPKLDKDDPKGLGVLTIRDYVLSTDRDKKPRHALRDNDGRMWRIKNKAREDLLTAVGLCRGFLLNTSNWTVLPPPTTGDS